MLSFVLFGTVLGMNIYLILKKRLSPSFARIGLLTLLTGWAGSLSLTYSFPIFAAGPLAVLIAAYGLKAFGPVTEDNERIKKYVWVVMVLFFSVSLLSYAKGRRKHVFKNQSVGELTRPLEEVLPGGRLIRINSKTYRFFEDFKKARDLAGGSDVAVLPGLPAYWVTAARKNPFCVDWAIRGEVTDNQALINRAIKDLELHRGRITVLLIKEDVARLDYGLIELPTNATYQRVRSHFTKKGETEFFELYQ